MGVIYGVLSPLYRCYDPIYTGDRCDEHELELVHGEPWFTVVFDRHYRWHYRCIVVCPHRCYHSYVGERCDQDALFVHSTGDDGKSCRWCEVWTCVWSSSSDHVTRSTCWLGLIAHELSASLPYAACHTELIASVMQLFGLCDGNIT